MSYPGGLFALLLAHVIGCDGAPQAHPADAGPIGDGGGAIDAGVPTPPARVFATVVSHNEDDGNEVCARSLFGLSGAQRMVGEVVPPRDRYEAVRAQTVAFAHMVADEGGAYDLESDLPFLDAIARYDDAALMASTDGQNLAAWLATFAPEHVTIDAHSHEHGYLDAPVNYADVASQVESLSGVPSTGVVGGFVATPAIEVWTRFLTPPLRATRTAYEWSPGILWGGGSPGHTEDVEAAGVWRPTDPNEFLRDNPEGPLVNVGHYASGDMTGASIDELLVLLHAGELEAGHMYTAAVFVTQCDLDATDTEDMRALIRAHEADVVAGDLVWATLPEVARIFREEYASTPTILPRSVP